MMMGSGPMMMGSGMMGGEHMGGGMMGGGMMHGAPNMNDPMMECISRTSGISKDRMMEWAQQGQMPSQTEMGMLMAAGLQCGKEMMMGGGMMGGGPMMMGPEMMGPGGPMMGGGMMEGPMMMGSEGEYSEEQMCPLDQIKREAKRFGREASKLDSRVAQYEKRNVPIPQDLRSNAAALKQRIEELKSATDCDQVEQAMQDVHELMQEVNEGVMQLERFSQMGKMLKQATAEVNRIEKEYKRVAVKVQKRKINLDSVLAQVKGEIDSLRGQLDTARQAIGSSDPEAADDALQAFGDSMQGARELLEQVSRLLDASRIVEESAKIIKEAEREMKRLKAAGGDTTEAQDIFNEAKQWLAGLKEMLSGGRISDHEAVFDELERGRDLHEAFMEAVQQEWENLKGEEEEEEAGAEELGFFGIEKLFPRLQLPEAMRALVGPARGR